MRRHILGLIALASFRMGGDPQLLSAAESVSSGWAMGLRIGCVLGALWLAWPDLHRLPGWVWYVLPMGIVAVDLCQGILVFLAPALAAATFLYLLYRKIWRSPR